MAERPVFIPENSGQKLVVERMIPFVWNPGLAPSQKKKNVIALHESAELRNLKPILEVSSKSEHDHGQKLSAMNLNSIVGGREISLESAFQGSKIFEGGGPYNDIYNLSGREARKDSRLRNSGAIIGFHFEGEDFSRLPVTAFYDWLYINSLYRQSNLTENLRNFAGFTDIEFNPKRSINCQARSCATYVALEMRNALDDALESFGLFCNLLQQGKNEVSGIL